MLSPNIKIINNIFIQVKHSQKMNEKVLKPWIIFLDDGSISCGHCTCMAGLGEVCSHVAALAFALMDQTNKGELSCTDKLSAWTVPKTNKKIIPKTIKEINWGKVSSSYSGKFDLFHYNIESLEFF